MSIGNVTGNRRPLLDTSADLVRTKQSFKAECDINNILARFKRDGQIAHINRNAGRYLDLTRVGDFRESLERVSEATEFFMGLSASTRAQFDNDPAAFLDFMNTASLEELEEAGLVALRQDPNAPEEVSPPDQPPAPSPSGSGEGAGG